MVLARLQVRITFLSPCSFMTSIFFSNFGSTNGPFFNDRPIHSSPNDCDGCHLSKVPVVPKLHYNQSTTDAFFLYGEQCIFQPVCFDGLAKSSALFTPRSFAPRITTSAA